MAWKCLLLIALHYRRANPFNQDGYYSGRRQEKGYRNGSEKNEGRRVKATHLRRDRESASLVLGMMRVKYLIKFVMTVACVHVLTGCPVMDSDLDKRYPSADITRATLKGNDLCIAVPYTADYRLRMISIYPRGSGPKTRWYKDEPDLNLTINQGQLCIDPAFYTFEEHRQYVVRAVMWSDKKYKETRFGSRLVMAAFEIENDHAYRVVLEEREL